MPAAEHVTPVRTYVAVCVCLLLLTALTVAVAQVNLGPLNSPAALAIAAVKAGLIALFFMHLRWATGVTRLFAVAALVWLAIIMGGTLEDVLTRDWLTTPGK